MGSKCSSAGKAEILMEDGYLKDREEDAGISLRLVVERQFVRKTGGWNWLRIVSNARFLYWWC
jgi:hypothetical protein